MDPGIYDFAPGRIKMGAGGQSDRITYPQALDFAGFADFLCSFVTPF